ncbi:hypothetical protein E8E13_004004 [Curvularia kusanoi]|uniref:RING-type domain-containing protein n=1 Tax=Curvularia kusanoi TaxID=90978 RepID=A0A9P4W7Y4_CURKU|nr:hypothetical protein E8E13_004004 [Curvularia kusanoi]
MPPGISQQDFLTSLEEITCPICLQSFDDTHYPVSIDGCRHIFGVDCLKIWAQSDSDNYNTCPTCRAVLFGQSSYELQQLTDQEFELYRRQQANDEQFVVRQQSTEPQQLIQQQQPNEQQQPNGRRRRRRRGGRRHNQSSQNLANPNNVQPVQQGQQQVAQRPAYWASWILQQQQGQQQSAQRPAYWAESGSLSAEELVMVLTDPHETADLEPEWLAWLASEVLFHRQEQDQEWEDTLDEVHTYDVLAHHVLLDGGEESLMHKFLSYAVKETITAILTGN